MFLVISNTASPLNILLCPSERKTHTKRSQNERMGHMQDIFNVDRLILFFLSLSSSYVCVFLRFGLCAFIFNETSFSRLVWNFLHTVYTHSNKSDGEMLMIQSTENAWKNNKFQQSWFYTAALLFTYSHFLCSSVLFFAFIEALWLFQFTHCINNIVLCLLLSHIHASIYTYIHMD